VLESPRCGGARGGEGPRCARGWGGRQEARVPWPRTVPSRDGRGRSTSRRRSEGAPAERRRRRLQRAVVVYLGFRVKKKKRLQKRGPVDGCSTACKGAYGMTHAVLGAAHWRAWPVAASTASCHSTAHRHSARPPLAQLP
jgi:hypothetical protein